MRATPTTFYHNDHKPRKDRCNSSAGDNCAPWSTVEQAETVNKRRSLGWGSVVALTRVLVKGTWMGPPPGVECLAAQPLWPTTGSFCGRQLAA